MREKDRMLEKWIRWGGAAYGRCRAVGEEPAGGGGYNIDAERRGFRGE